jgi:hypothetical protein
MSTRRPEVIPQHDIRPPVRGRRCGVSTRRSTSPSVSGVSSCTGTKCAASGFVSERNQHQGADADRRVDDRRKQPCPYRWYPCVDHQVPQSAEAHDKSAYADNSGRRDRAAVRGARRAGTDTESDPVDDAQEEERRDRSGADLNDDEWDQAPNGVHDVADQTDQRRPDQEAPKNRTARRWFFAAASVWVGVRSSAPSHQAPDKPS